MLFNVKSNPNKTVNSSKNKTNGKKKTTTKRSPRVYETENDLVFLKKNSQKRSRRWRLTSMTLYRTVKTKKNTIGHRVLKTSSFFFSTI